MAKWQINKNDLALLEVASAQEELRSLALNCNFLFKSALSAEKMTFLTQPKYQVKQSVTENSQDLPFTEQLLIKGCVAGDRGSQAKLYHAYARKMMGICMWYAPNREEAEEILQDGFIRVFNYINKYNWSGSFEGWVRKIMVNCALSKYRNKTYLTPVLEFNADIHGENERHSVIELLEAKELVSMVQRLTPGYRIVFNLYALEGMKHREIAQLLGISEGTSKSNLADARAILQKTLRNQNTAVYNLSNL